jgi:hypothetical protein
MGQHEPPGGDPRRARTRRGLAAPCRAAAAGARGGRGPARRSGGSCGAGEQVHARSAVPAPPTREYEPPRRAPADPRASADAPPPPHDPRACAGTAPRRASAASAAGVGDPGAGCLRVTADADPDRLATEPDPCARIRPGGAGDGANARAAHSAPARRDGDARPAGRPRSGPRPQRVRARAAVAPRARAAATRPEPRRAPSWRCRRPARRSSRPDRGA